MLGRLLGFGDAPSYKTEQPESVRVSGSLFASKKSGEAAIEQVCVYLSCEAFVRPTSTQFKHELVVSRSDEVDGDDDSSFPPDIVFTIERKADFDNDGERFGWSDRTGKRYNLDVLGEDRAKDLRDAISLALFQNIHSALPGSADESELENLLARPNLEHAPDPEVENERLLIKGELFRTLAELFKYSPAESMFISLSPSVVVTINSAVTKEDNSRAYLLMVFDEETGNRMFECDITPALNPLFYSSTLSLVWLMAMDPDADPEALERGEIDEENTLCLSIKLKDSETFVRFRNQFSVCVYEVTNNASIDDLKLKDDEIEYIKGTARDDVEPMDIEDNEEEEQDERHISEFAPNSATIAKQDDGMTNSHLAIAANHDRTFVVRGNKMGVFQTQEDGAEWKATIDFKDHGSRKEFTPSKILLHEMDRSMLLLDPDDDSKIMRMDLERGEVVDTWQGGLTSGTPVKTLQKVSKYANMTDAQDFVGLNRNQLLRMDPRTSEFIVQSKKYAAGTRARLNCMATTGQGYLAVASDNGDIRLFDQIGKNAKTLLPGISSDAVGIDVSEDGFFILVTTPKYLLVVDTRVKGQEKGGFLKSMGKNKPVPRKLTIKNEDVVKHKMGEVNFTTAHFNTGTSMERSIITSTGPFIVVWNFRQVKLGHLDSYKIRRYQDTVVADNFTYNNDGRIIVTMPNDVNVVNR